MFQRAWQWLVSLFQARERLDTYTIKERCIYRYAIGGCVIRDADPMVLYRRWRDVAPALAADIKGASFHAKMPTKLTAGSRDAMLEKMRGIFDVKPFDQGGLTEEETIWLFNHFLTYIEGEKKNTSPPPTLEEPPDPLPPSVPLPEESPVTPNSSDSGCATNEPSTELPGPSPTPPPSPTEP